MIGSKSTNFLYLIILIKFDAASYNYFSDCKINYVLLCDGKAE